MGIDFTEDEKLLVKLDEVARRSDQASIRETCRSLLLWYQRRGEWTTKQRYLIGQLTQGFQRTRVIRRRARPKPAYSLYAVRLGSELKVGMTCRLEERIGAYRTGCADVELLHEIKLGAYGRPYARAQEKKLHRVLRARGHWIARELFRLAALADIRQFVPKPPKQRPSASVAAPAAEQGPRSR